MAVGSGSLSGHGRPFTGTWINPVNAPAAWPNRRPARATSAAWPGRMHRRADGGSDRLATLIAGHLLRRLLRGNGVAGQCEQFTEEFETRLRAMNVAFAYLL